MTFIMTEHPISIPAKKGDAARHFPPSPDLWICNIRFHYDRIIHLFSASKAFGMPGWRVGYLVHPSSMAGDLRKVSTGFKLL